MNRLTQVLITLLMRVQIKLCTKQNLVSTHHTATARDRLPGPQAAIFHTGISLCHFRGVQEGRSSDRFAEKNAYNHGANPIFIGRVRVSSITEMPGQLEMGAWDGENGVNGGCPDFGLESHLVWDGLFAHGEEVASLWGLIACCMEERLVAFRDGLAVRVVPVGGVVSAFEERGRHRQRCCRWLEQWWATMVDAVVLRRSG